MATSTGRGRRLILALENYAKNPSFSERWDATNVFRKITMTSAGDGYMRGHFTVDSAMCNSGDSLHGGFIASLLDTTTIFGYGSHPLGAPSVTSSLQIYYMRPAMLGDRVEFCTTPLRINKVGGLVDSTLVDSKGRQLVRATAVLQVPTAASSATFKQCVEKNLAFDFEDTN